MDPLSERLRQERERQRRSIDDLSMATRIPRRVLEALEAGNYTLLPVFYMRSHLRTYATTLGFPKAEIDRALDDVLPLDAADQTLLRPAAPQPPPKAVPKSPVAAQPQAARPQQQTPPERPKKERPKTERASVATAMAADVAENVKERLRALRMPTFDMEEATKRTPRIALIVAGAIIVIVVGAYFLFRDSNEEPSTASTVEEVTVGDGSADIGDKDSLILTAEASDTAWITITADGDRSEQLVTLPGTEYRWSAMKEFRLSLSNAGALTFYRNGTKLPVFGKQGEIVRQVVITRKDYTSSSVAWKTTPTRPQATVVEEPQKPAQRPAAVQPQRTAPQQQVVKQPVQQPRPRTVQRTPQRTVQKAPQKKAPAPKPVVKTTPTRKPATRPEIKEVPVKPLLPKR